MRKSTYSLNSMADFNSIPTGNFFYIISEKGQPWGIYGITNNPKRRFCEYLRDEPDAVTWKNNIELYLWKGPRSSIQNLETSIKRVLRKDRYDDVFVQNRRGNQLEFFPNEYKRFMISLVERKIVKMDA